MTTSTDTVKGRLDAYLSELAAATGHRDREGPLRSYLTGLLIQGERKSVEPMARRINPRRLSACHQSMHHFVAVAPWDDDAVLRAARDHVLPTLERHAPVGAWIIDDTSIVKKGRHSVGVARQYCGAAGKRENCQTVVTISLANTGMSVPAAYRLYLPDSWANDAARRRAAGVPDEVVFRTKWEIALDRIDGLLADDLPRAPVLADAGYGNVTEFRDALSRRGLRYAVGVQSDTSVWPEGAGPLPPRPRSGRGQPGRRLRRDAEHRPTGVAALARSLDENAWKTVLWREGTRGALTSRFAAVRVRPANRDYLRTTPRDEEWLMVEWPEYEPEPIAFTLSNAPAGVPLDDLVRMVKLRWRVERDYEDMKQELGLGHFEGRGWRGFHHHGILCIAAYAFLSAERARLSPPEPWTFLKAAALPKGFRPRGAPRPARKAQPHLHRHQTP